MKSNIIFSFSFFFVYLCYVSCNKSVGNTAVNNDEDQEELYIKNKKMEKLKSIVSGDFVGNYKNNEDLLNKKIEEVQNSKEKNVHVLINGNSIIDEIEKNQENNDNEENNDNDENNGDDNIYELDMNDDTFLGQNDGSNFENVDDELAENEQSDEDKEKSESFPLFHNLGLFGKNVLSKVKAQNETSSPPQNQQKVLTQNQGLQDPLQGEESKFKKELNKKFYNLGDVFNNVVHISNKENKINVNNYGDKYLNFKKQYEDFVLNSKEYDIIKNLIIMFGKEDNKSKNSKTDNISEAKHITDIFIKILDDEKYHEQFKNFIYGIYSYAKQNSHLNEKKIKPEDEYKKFLEYSFNLLNTM
ncbi:merozoite surface protein 7 [Plasmodium sp. DRC-Itaito]|nr:merozoite surface protein 7 [Plasmodium sp. DRC-Itaito]